jgi:hypothetical protein
MCFNAEITASMLVLNFATGLWLQSRGQKLARTQVRCVRLQQTLGGRVCVCSFFALCALTQGASDRPYYILHTKHTTHIHHQHHQTKPKQIFYVFGIMELLQLIQYMVIDRCDSWVNQLATALSFIHICFQPLSVNVFVMREEPNRDVAKTVFGLCIMAGIFEAFRLPYLGLNSLPSWVRTYLPGLPDVALAGSPEVCAWEDICGPLTCARRGKLHLAWTVPLAPPAYFAPSGFVHFLLFFGPALVAPGVWHLERIAFVVVALLSGPVAAQAASYWAAGGEPGWRLEWAGVWCLFAVVQSEQRFRRGLRVAPVLVLRCKSILPSSTRLARL